MIEAATATFSAETLKDDLVILLYHGVTDSQSHGIENYSAKHLQVDEFARQIEYVSKNCNVLSIDDIVTRTRNNEPFGEYAVAITFDDGFRNNYTTAAPVLEKFGVPAVFYISSGIVNSTIMFWVDILEDCLNLSKKDRITVQLDNSVEFLLREDSEKIQALKAIKSFCKKSNEETKNRILAQVQEQTGVTASVDHASNYEKISWSELRAMNSSDLFTIGGHSMYHDILSALPPEKMASDVELSIRLLEYNLNQQITHYSYPEGQENHYNEMVIDKLKELGIVCSPSAIAGTNRPQTDLFHLKRIMPGFMGAPFPYS